MNWYAFYPAGTLLFKGAEPMVMGADHHASQIFPPPAQTIVGALRTAVLVQNDISYEDYYKNIVPPEILASIGEAGNPDPFQVAGPLLRINERIFVPAPFSWFIDKAEKGNEKVRIVKAQPTRSNLIKARDEYLFWAKGGSGEMVSLGGRWIKIEDLFSTDQNLETFSSDHFCATESRTGIALKTNRSVRRGHLYTFTHVRLKPEVSIAFGTGADLHLLDKGFLKLGAEQRFGRYLKIREPFFPKKTSGYFLSLNLVKGSKKANQAVIATGKIQYIGGWDLKTGFHKPMQGFFPAGSIFSENIHSNFVQI
ncbi:MAG: type III-B CRISPR module-associated Cmr3 family protein [Thermodesulfobacteriota bacterium]